eukprot:CAMPEP_0179369490 /NCGR_PEP_ID=MMETSP0797-20121207/84643_1 /TAXON_ID=47934 /ORGANISM="Dinophysis acuminata, Strain DAEP01" /LENGTH=184 /DNA_ID=CAMNT_0021085125 /DNA_START=87 /DNA_END=639 /DNA_ORIENTATION=+
MTFLRTRASGVLAPECGPASAAALPTAWQAFRPHLAAGRFALVAQGGPRCLALAGGVGIGMAPRRNFCRAGGIRALNLHQGPADLPEQLPALMHAPGQPRVLLDALPELHQNPCPGVTGGRLGATMEPRWCLLLARHPGPPPARPRGAGALPGRAGPEALDGLHQPVVHKGLAALEGQPAHGTA